MKIEQQERLKNIIDKIGSYNEGAKLDDEHLIIYNEGGYNATVLNIDDLHTLSDLLRGIRLQQDINKRV